MFITQTFTVHFYQESDFWEKIGYVFLGAAVACEAVAHFLEDRPKRRRIFERLSIISLVVLTFGDIEAAHYRTIEDRARDALLSRQSTTITALTQQLNDAGKTISDLRGQMDNAEKEATEAELALAKLKVPRSLSAAQRRQLVSELKPFAGTQLVIAFKYADPEIRNLTMQLFVVLQSAGWKVDLDPFSGAGLGPEVTDRPGITVGRFGEFKLPSGATTQHTFARAAKALSQALRKLELLNTGSGGIDQVSGNLNDRVIMVVGRKPF